MIYNDKVATEYGIDRVVIGEFPVAYRPTPSVKDYSIGFFVRWFSKRVNSNVAIEISPEQSTKIDENIYSTTSLTWKISGPKDSKVVNGIIESEGVAKSNQREIQRVKREDEIDLSQTLKNPLEFWRGY